MTEPGAGERPDVGQVAADGAMDGTGVADGEARRNSLAMRSSAISTARLLA